jgi:serine phosphatase RsbU (regulator of sigma subunit)
MQKQLSVETDQDIDHLNSEAWMLSRKDPKKAIELANSALQSSEANNYLKGKAIALKTIGACNTWLANYEAAFSTGLMALELLKQAGEKSEEAQVNYNIGTNFYYLSDYENALKYYFQCYKLNVENNNQLGIADAQNGMGTVYYTTGRYELAIENLEKSLATCKKEGDTAIQQKVLDGLGAAYAYLKKYDKALEYMHECIHIVKNHGGSSHVEAFALNGIGNIYSQYGDFDKSLNYYNQSLVIRRSIDFKVGEADTLYHIGLVYEKLKDTSKAFEIQESAFHLAQSIQSKEWIYQSAEALSRIYELNNDYKKAIEYHKIFHTVKDEVINEKADKKLKSLELQFKLEQTEKEKNLLQLKNEDLKSYNNDVTLLSDIGQKIISSLDVETIVDTVYESINNLMDASGFGIGLVIENGDTLIFPLYMENGDAIRNIRYDTKDKNRLAVWCLSNAKEVLINDFHTEASKYITVVQKPLAGKNVDSIIYLPLFTKNKVIGVITVQSFIKNAYSNYHLTILRNLAVYAAIALENAHLYKGVEEEVKNRTTQIVQQKEEIERTYKNIKLLSDIGQQITSTLKFKDIFTKLYENVNRLMDAECFGVRILHAERNVVEYKFEMENGRQEEPLEVSMDNDDNYSVWCIKNKKEIFINDNENEYKKYTNKIIVVSGSMPHSLIFYPMMIGNRVLGVITIQSFKKFAYTSHHLDILRTLGTYTAIALDNANLYENLEEKVKERTMEVMEQKNIIEQKQKEIKDSINYARKIQDATLPLQSEFLENIPQSFFFYKPKDVVSGDFYWLAKNENKILVAAADCTGHGVPGAFMSMLGNNKLDYAVIEKGETCPGKILEILNQQIKSTLKQNTDSSLSKDGMDIILCSIDKNNSKIEFAGANRPLYHVRNGIINELSCTKVAIGGLTSLDQNFEQQELVFQKNDMIYLCTDGYADQFGGANGKKFMKKRFKELLAKISGMHINKQYEFLVETFEKWQLKQDQVDDILVMGIRL